MRALDIKLIRDFRRLWAQALAIALVMASGVATLVLASGASLSLEESRSAYYERNRFADVFATLTRAPLGYADNIREIPGVAAAEPRIQKFALLDMPGFLEPVTGLAISLPDGRPPRLNVLYLREGRLAEEGRFDEVVVNEQFARAHGLTLGDTLQAMLNGRRCVLRVVGIAISPEFIYAIGPGAIMPDDRRFAVLWMSQKALGTLSDLDGAFNNLALALLPGSDEAEIVRQVDALLARYGGTGAYGRKDQVSHGFIDAELLQLRSLTRVIPPIFLAVAAFLINMTLSRLVALEREQIGVLKAIGYANRDVAGHYVKLMVLISLVGVAIGLVAGSYLGGGLTRLYGRFFHFPVLVFRNDPGIYALAALVSSGAAVVGGLKSVLDVARLPPAVAMQPPAPARFKRVLPRMLDLSRHVSQVTVMAFRQMVHSPMRSMLTMLGLALAVALLVTSLLSYDSVELMIDVEFNLTDRQQATLRFTEPRGPRVIDEVMHLPGVLRVEPVRTVAARLTKGERSRQLAILGKPPRTDLTRILDRNLVALELPSEGLVLGERVAELMGLKTGDRVEIEFLEGKRRRATVPVVEVIKSYFGLMAYMDLDALNALTNDGPRVSSVDIAFDTNRALELFAAVKNAPAIASIALQREALAKFRETIAQNIGYMVSVYVTLAIIIAFGIVYNSARIQLSERARELASLRVLGFTRAEVGRVLLTELAILSVACLPFGWAIGYGFGWLLIKSYSSDLYRVPFTVSAATYATAALIVLTASASSALLVRRRVDHLDLVAVLKTRE